MDKIETNTLTIILKYDGRETEWIIDNVQEKDADKAEKIIDKIYHDVR